MEMRRWLGDPRLRGAGWLAARCWVGWEFLSAGREKVTGPERAAWIGGQAGAAVRGFLGYSLQMAPGGKLAGPHPEVQGWYATMIRHALLPHATLFGYLVVFGEVLVGVALILGFATRFAAAMGLLMNLAYLFAGVSSAGPLMVLIELPLLLVGASAGFYGLDRFALPALRRVLARPARAPARRATARPTLQAG